MRKREMKHQIEASTKIYIHTLKILRLCT